MSKVTPEKTHALLEKLSDYVTSQMATKEEVNNQITDVNNKIDKLASYVINEVPRKDEVVTKQDMAVEINGLRTEMNAELTGLRYEMNTGFSALRNEMNTKFNQVESALLDTRKDIRLILDGMDSHPAFPGLDRDNPDKLSKYELYRLINN